MMGLIGQSLSALPIKHMQATQLFNGCNLDDTQRQSCCKYCSVRFIELILHCY